LIKTETIHKIYAGWLGKMIGVRLGSPIEGWTYEQIHHVYGEIYGYLKDCKRFGSDDDTTVPLFLLRALEDSGFHLTPQAVGDALLNYSPYERGFFWWGGYGVSTEHTAYLNLRHGIQAPLSGSVEHNGRAVAEQIGGQIFIDVWGLVCPGNPDLAAEYAQMAASVTHGGNGIYGGMFVAACIAYAFCDNHIRGMIEKGLTYIPGDCEYAKAVRAVMVYHDEHPESWQDCYQYIYSNFGYDKYPGACHIIPNICVMILALLYGGGDFTQTLCIGAMCGWDTDCNVGNLGAIMGVMVGLERIDYARWIQPVNDFLATASVIGSLNHMDIPYGASYMAKLASTVSGSKLPPPWDMITSGRIDSCHFEYPGSTHAMEVRLENAACDAILFNSDEAAYTGSRSLKVHVPLPRHAKESVYIFSRTSLSPEDFTGTFNYGSGFSPRLYPGQTIHGSVMIPSYGSDCAVCLYARDAVSG
jgi:ADP-ribosylglycohydrolase